jgi:hypothetical protein
VHAEVVTNGLHLRGFAGLPDGSEWVADELVWDEGGTAEAGGVEIARRMALAGADRLLREAEAMAA